ncbi:MAG: universal stress protein [Acidimicrobiales bacterium]|nr:MAG: universal stress protein [Acidimicrobiales bacterium]
MSIRKIVCGHDGSEDAARATEFAAELAKAVGAEVLLVNAFDPLVNLGAYEPPYDFGEIRRDVVRQLESEWAEPLRRMEVAHRCELVEDTPVHALLSVAAREEADMIVIGSRGLGALRGTLVGSVALKLPTQAHCPVTIVPRP